jgi:hypothetical protein
MKIERKIEVEFLMYLANLYVNKQTSGYNYNLTFLLIIL